MLLILIAAALAAEPAPSLYSDAMPPEVFRKDASFMLELKDQHGISQSCDALFGPAPAGLQITACQTGSRIIAPNPCSYPQTESYARMLCHELGHLNGWSALHEDVRRADSGSAPSGALTQPSSAGARR